MIGEIISYRDAKGYGFLKADGRDGELFFLRSDITHRGCKSVDVGDRVHFDLAPDERKPGHQKATNVRRSLRFAIEAASYLQ